MKYGDTALAGTAIVVAGGSGLYAYRSNRAIHEKLESVMAVVTEHDKLLKRFATDIDKAVDMVSDTKVVAETCEYRLRFVTNELKIWSKTLQEGMQQKEITISPLIMEPPRKKHKKKYQKPESNNEESSSDEEEDIRMQVKKMKPTKTIFS